MAPHPSILNAFFRRTPSLPLSKRTLPTPNGPVDLGTGTKSPTEINNQIFLGLFATIGSLMVLATIYFFFIAKNGGFKRIEKKDWDDYKTTVLRRKGPNGTTLSNATKSTRLGGGSVVPKWARSEFMGGSEGSEGSEEGKDMGDLEMGGYGGGDHRGGGNKYRRERGHDPELAAYKHERAAMVGGINTSLHGTSQWDASNTDRSEVTVPPMSKKDKAKEEKERKRREKEAQKQASKGAKDEKKARKGQERRGKKGVQQNDDTTSVYTSTNTATTATDAYTSSGIRQVSYYDSYRPASNLTPVREQATPVSSHHSTNDRRTSSHHRQSRESMSNNNNNNANNHRSPDHRQSPRQSPSHSRQSSPRKSHRSSRPHSDYGSHSHTASSDSGTKVYTHHIPGLSKGEVGFDDSVSQVAANHAQRSSRGASHSNNGAGGASSNGYRRGGRGRRDSLSESEM